VVEFIARGDREAGGYRVRCSRGTETSKLEGEVSWGYGPPSGGATTLSRLLWRAYLGYDTLEELVVDWAEEVATGLNPDGFLLPERELASWHSAYRLRDAYTSGAEFAVIGLLLTEPADLCLTPDDFSLSVARLLYERIQERREAGQPTANTDLQLDVLDGLLPGVAPDPPWALHDSAPDGPSVAHWAREVRDGSRRRRGWPL